MKIGATVLSLPLKNSTCIMLLKALCISLFLSSFTIHIADTPEKRRMGFMGYQEIPKNYGILFPSEKPIHFTLWMYNVYEDLSVLFLDEEGVIIEIQELKSYPEMLDPKIPKETQLQFFSKKAIESKNKASYALEVKKGEIEKNHWKIGTKIEFLP